MKNLNTYIIEKFKISNNINLFKEGDICLRLEYYKEKEEKIYCSLNKIKSLDFYKKKILLYLQDYTEKEVVFDRSYVYKIKKYTKDSKYLYLAKTYGVDADETIIIPMKDTINVLNEILKNKSIDINSFFNKESKKLNPILCYHSRNNLEEYIPIWIDYINNVSINKKDEEY